MNTTEIAVLGIDAAWTARQPSGVALIAKHQDGWRLVGAAASYSRFVALADPQTVPEGRPSGASVSANSLISAAQGLCRVRPSFVAIDMPMAHSPITCRREADNAVSRIYGARKCGTHTPNPDRPGQIGQSLHDGFTSAGYPLQTEVLSLPGLIEVYPHPALVELTAAAERLPYKAGKARAYWPSMRPSERRDRLLEQWASIVAALDAEIVGVAALSLPASSASGVDLKAFEDLLDAIICAWVGMTAIEGRARPFGDRDAAIWIPADC